MANENNLPEIPEELLGISEDIAREIMSQIPQNVETGEAQLDPETKPTETNADDAVSSEDDKEVDSEGVKEVDPDDGQEVDLEDEDDDVLEDGQQSTQPKGDLRVALRKEREKGKTRDKELEELRKELADIKAKQQVPQQQPLVPSLAQPQAPRAAAAPKIEAPVQSEVDSLSYTEKLYTEAEKVFAERYKRSPNEKVTVRAKAEFTKREGREPDPFNDDDQDALADMRAQITRDDTIRLNQIVYDLDAGVKQHVAQQRTEQEHKQAEQQRVNTMYGDLVKEAEAKPYHKELDTFAAERVKQLPPEMRDYIASAFQRAATGQGSMQDIAVAKSFWESSELLFEKQKAAEVSAQATQQTPTPSVPDKTAGAKKAEKAKAAQSIPRSVNINGGATAGNITAAELERKLNDGTITDDELEILKKGG